MSGFDNFDVEIQNECDSTPEHFNGDLGTAGTVTTITPTSGKQIQFAIVVNPGKGSDKNSNNDVIYASIDGTDPNTKRVTVNKNGRGRFNGLFTELKMTSNNNDTNYEVILYS